MNYSEEETRAYQSMIYSVGIYEDLRKSILWNKCEVHKKKLKINISYDYNYEISTTISDYCCTEFAKQVAKTFEEKIEAHSCNIFFS